MNMDPLAVSLSSLRCTGCGSTDVVVIDPGALPVIDVESDSMLSRGRCERPVSGRCLACWTGAKEPRPVECWRCAGTDADGLAFSRRRKPRGRPLLCEECAAEPAPAVPVFVRATYRRHAVARASGPQMDLDDMARGGL